jgi:hypothetical protein
MGVVSREKKRSRVHVDTEVSKLARRASVTSVEEDPSLTLRMRVQLFG